MFNFTLTPIITTLETTDDTQQVINVGSTVGSVEGDVNINAGKAYTQTASDVLTPQGDINITVQSVCTDDQPRSPISFISKT